LVDTGFDAEKSGFTRISGLPNVTYSLIEAGANVTHSIVVQASVAGYYNMSAAKVTFSSEGDEEAQVRPSKATAGCVCWPVCAPRPDK
jgi:translocon-associated protein subunit beta